MEDVSKALMVDKSQEMVAVEEMPEWMEQIDRHVLTGTSEYFFLKNEQALLDFIKLIGHEKVKSEQIIAYYYSAHGYELYEKTGNNVQYDGEMSLLTVVNRLGDIGAMLELPNDYRLTVSVALDSETMVVYQQTVSSEPGVCDNCFNSTDPDIMLELKLNEGMHGCGHTFDEYFIDNQVVLTKRLSSEKAQDGMVHLSF